MDLVRKFFSKNLPTLVFFYLFFFGFKIFMTFAFFDKILRNFLIIPLCIKYKIYAFSSVKKIKIKTLYGEEYQYS